MRRSLSHQPRQPACSGGAVLGAIHQLTSDVVIRGFEAGRESETATGSGVSVQRDRWEVVLRDMVMELGGEVRSRTLMFTNVEWLVARSHHSHVAGSTEIAF